MISTPKSLKLGFYRNSYNRVSFLKSGRNAGNIPDGEPLQDVKLMQQNGKVHDLSSDYINYGMEDEMEIQGYKKNKLRTTITWISIFLTLGILRLLFHWWPHWMLYSTHKKCPLESADKVLVIERYQLKHKCFYVKTIKTITSDETRDNFKVDDKNLWDQSLVNDLENWESAKLSVHASGGIFKEVDSVRLFSCKKMTYIWDPDLGVFYKLRGLDFNITGSYLHEHKGLSATQQFFRRAVYGLNEIIVPMRSVTALLFLEVLNPFYIFQIFSFTLWIVDNYVYYALCILAMSCVSVGFAVAQTRKNQKNLWSRVHSRDVANVMRGGDVAAISTDQLVPGDVLVLPSHGCVMHCDAVLLAGSCIVNESMLTGESVPVTKTPIPKYATLIYNEKEHARHTLFSGTQVIQTRFYGHERVYAVVIRTSFATAKGNLVRSILYPPPVDFKFERDSYKFVQMLAAFAACGVLYTVISKVLRGNEWSEITLEALDLITIVVPPALPAAMTVGRMYAQGRLEKSNIFCISPRTINVSGSINCVCFDKTGTLTEDGLDMWGVVPAHNSKFHPPLRNIQSLPANEHFLKGMVTCHGITMIEGNLVGDPLDLKMFESTGWVLEEPDTSDVTKFDLISPTVVKPGNQNNSVDSIHEDPLEIAIVRQFPFSSNLQRMSVITRRLGASNFTLYCKGSPEMILSLCNSKTVPVDFEQELEGYTCEGYRVLGIGYKELPSKLGYAKMQRLSREDAESDLTFLGLVVMENRLKPETSGVLDVLRDANVRTVMVTGDNMLTALSVARDCGIVPCGQRVIMVHTANNQNSGPPIVYFTQSHAATSPTDTVHVISEISQMTNTESITSLQTLDSLTVNQLANGTARNSIIIDLPIDNTIEEVGKASVDYSFALTGSTWTVLRSNYPDIMNRVARRGAVFARMSPDHKQQLVQTLQTLDYFVAMVGDGANDCGALKAAHAGISLSEAESSVASPFTSREPNISCIVGVIREGRAALVTSFAIFKYMAAYSLMQFASVLILYSIDNNLTDIEFLYIDLFVITTFAFVLGRVESFQGPLFPKAPQSSLISAAPILSLLGQMVIAITAQLFSFYFVQQCSWYSKEHENDSGIAEGGYENYSVFTVSSLQYIILALTFSKGAPYRKSLLSTPGMVCLTLTITLFTLYLALSPCTWLVKTFELSLPPSIMFRLLMVLVGFINLILAFLYEFICDYVQETRTSSYNKTTLKHEEIEQEMIQNKNWPEITTEPPPVESSPKFSRMPTTVTVVTPQNVRKLSMIGSESHLDEKYSTPMRSFLSLPRGVGQSEDSLSRYLTPPTSPTPSPSHHQS